MPEPGIFIDGGVILAVATLVVREFLRTRNSKKNGNPVDPKTWTEHCTENAATKEKTETNEKMIAEVKIAFEGYRKENREDHSKIFDKLEELLKGTK